MKITPRSDDSAEERDAREQFRDDHVQILRMVGELAGETRVSAIAAAMETLEERLVRHFREEEGRSGIFGQIERARPDLEPRLAGLRAQHRELLGLIQTVARAAAAGEPEDQIIARRDQLLKKLRAHEATETRLLTDSVYQDLGVGD